jgi:hypothetical protein
LLEARDVLGRVLGVAVVPSALTVVAVAISLTMLVPITVVGMFVLVARSAFVLVLMAVLSSGSLALGVVLHPVQLPLELLVLALQPLLTFLMPLEALLDVLLTPVLVVPSARVAATFAVVLVVLGHVRPPRSMNSRGHRRLHSRWAAAYPKVAPSTPTVEGLLEIARR